MSNKELNELLSLNKYLIEQIRVMTTISLVAKVDDHVIHSHETERIYKSVVREYLLPQLDDLIEKYKNNAPMLARYQIGLSKYLDYYSFEWLDEKDHLELDRLVTKIVDMSFKINEVSHVSVTNFPPCDSKHDDGACETKQLGPRFYNKGNDLTYKQWPRLPKKDVVNFACKPNPIRLSKGTILFRIIEKGINNINGVWWIRETELPIVSKTVWRAGHAVRENWNKDNDCIAIKVPYHLYVWVGPAASQQASDTCILSGGKEQVWVSQKDIHNLVKKSLDLKLSFNWPLSSSSF